MVAPGGYQQNGEKKAVGTGQNFFSRLLDTSFTEYVTLDFVKVIYTILMVVVGVMWVGGLIVSFAAFSQGAAVGMISVVVFLIMGTLSALFWLILMRVSLEFWVAMMRNEQNTRKIAEAKEKDSDL